MNSLNSLLIRINDSKSGYKEVAEQVGSDAYKDLFAQYAAQRKRFSSEIENEVRMLGAVPEQGTSIKGDIHQLWIDIRALLSRHNDDDMLIECERGEKALIDAYETVLSDESVVLPPSTRGLLLDQLAAVHSSLERMRSLNMVAA
ncbi:MAG: PA2169 family four-helix-bundle protein [Bacteroidia bacterium]